MSRTIKLVVSITVFFLSAFSLKAQSSDGLGTFTPYSLFGIGDVVKQGTAYNRAMGGIGVGVRDNKFINYLNPASITARDTLAFMIDFGIIQKNFYNSDGGAKSAYNVFNMQNIVLTAPIYKKSALIVGISPFSDIGYNFESLETNPELITNVGDIMYQKYGTGGISQFFAGAAITFLRDFSFGAQMVYYFGSIDRYSNVLFTTDYAYDSVITGWDYAVGAVSGNFGLQYTKTFNKDYNLTVGLAYRMGVNLKGDFTRSAFANSQRQQDTLYFDRKDTKLYVPDEYSAGFSFRKKDKWMIGFDYARQDWSKSTFEATAGSGFAPRASQSFKAGFEITPNRYDVRYYLKRCTYKVGLYYDQSYLSFDKSGGIDAKGITLGFSVPVYRFYNSINFAIDLGQRGSLKDNMVRERYVMFQLNMSLHDIWFRKPKYD